MNWEDEPEWVELGECDSVQELMMVRGLLESAGIECFSPNELPYSHKKGLDSRGLVLQVQAKDLAAARAILEAPFDPPATESDDEDTD